MRRKIIKQKTAYTITLPIDWCRNKNLTGDEEVDIQEDGNDLRISVEQQQKPKHATVSLKGADKELTRIQIENHYLMGYTQLTLTDVKHSTHVKKITRNLIGFELINEQPWTIKATSTPTQEEFSTLFRRIIHIIADALEVGANSSTDQHFEDIRRYGLYCARSITLLHHVPREVESYAQLLVEQLILIGHSIAAGSAKNKGLGKPWRQTQVMWRLWQEYFLENKAQQTAIFSLYEELRADLEKKIRKHNANVQDHYAHMIAEKIFLITQPRYQLRDTLLTKFAGILTDKRGSELESAIQEGRKRSRKRQL